MRYMALIIIFISIMPAILERMQFGKYKGIEKIIPAQFHENISRLIRNEETLNEIQLQKKTDEYIERIFEKVRKLLLVAGMIFFTVSFIPESGKATREIVRPERGSTEETVVLTKGNDSKKVKFVVNAWELTSEEFKEKAIKKKNEISDILKPYVNKRVSEEKSASESAAEMSGKTASEADKSLNITVTPSVENLGISKIAADNVKIKWSSTDPEIIDSSGKINWGLVQSDMDIDLEAAITDGTHEDIFQVHIHLKYEVKEMQTETLTYEELKKAEEKTRTDKIFLLPEKMQGYSLSKMQENTKKQVMFIFILTIFTIVLTAVFEIQHLKEKGKKRNIELEADYYRLISRLSLLLGAGINVRDAFRMIAESSPDGFLKKEIEFMINRMNSGMSEKTAIEEMGRNIGLQKYMRLASIISQNLMHGNRDLLNQLELEVTSGFEGNRERVRKRGEEASEKLMAPTFLLLTVVIGIVMYPALIGM